MNLHLRTTPWMNALAAGAILVALTAGCGSGGSGAGGPAPLFEPCRLDTRVGGFSVQLNESALGNAAHTALAGSVLTGVRPSLVWRPEGAAAGGCQLMVGPSSTCSPACVSPMVCSPQGQCISNPVVASVGDVTLTGVGPGPVVLSPLSSSAPAYSSSVNEPYPPFVPDAEILLMATGATLPGFSLTGKGFAPLVFEGTGIKAVGGQPLSFSWVPPAQPGAARIFAVMEIGHHGGVAARVECDLPDTGSGQIPAAIVSALIAKGAHGFPTLSLSRSTVDSTTIAPGCVDFTVAAFVERGITVCPTAGNCVESCTCGGPDSPCTGTDPSEQPCTGTRACQPDYTCL